jgi:hypothetical protein
MRDVVEYSDGWRMVRIAHWELKLQVENATCIRSFLRPSNVGVPSE